MNRKEFRSKSSKNNAADQATKKKEKEMRKLQQDLHMVSLIYTVVYRKVHVMMWIYIHVYSYMHRLYMYSLNLNMDTRRSSHCQ